MKELILSNLSEYVNRDQVFVISNKMIKKIKDEDKRWSLLNENTNIVAAITQTKIPSNNLNDINIKLHINQLPNELFHIRKLFLHYYVEIFSYIIKEIYFSYITLISNIKHPYQFLH